MQNLSSDPIFFTADQHFGHGKGDPWPSGICKFTERPFANINEHDKHLIRRWNETVPKNGLVFVLGDFAWKDHNHYIMALNGKKILVTGSHDKCSQISKISYTEVHNGMLVREIAGTVFVMTHCAMKVWERSHYGSVNLYGHSHGRLPEYPEYKQMDVGVDVADDYAPFSLKFVLYKMGFKVPKVYSKDENDINSIMYENRQKNLELLAKFKGLNNEER